VQKPPRVTVGQGQVAGLVTKLV